MTWVEECESFARDALPPRIIREHVQYVVNAAKMLLESYPEADAEVVLAGVWLHDVGHNFCGGIVIDDNTAKLHHERGEKIAREFLNSIDIPEEKREAVLHCVLAHRTSQPPEPETIEARIVGSVDNLSHFDNYKNLMEAYNDWDWLKAKLQRNIEVSFMLPEAREYAEKKFVEIKKEMESSGNEVGKDQSAS